MLSVPIVFLIPVKGGNPCHFLIAQTEIKDGDVFLDVVGIARTGNSHHAALQMPAEDDLYHRLAVLGRDGRQYRVAQQFALMSASAKRIPCFHDNAEIVQVFHHFGILIIRMHLILHQYRFDVYLRQEFIDFFHVIARHA